MPSGRGLTEGVERKHVAPWAPGRGRGWTPSGVPSHPRDRPLPPVPPVPLRPRTPQRTLDAPVAGPQAARRAREAHAPRRAPRSFTPLDPPVPLHVRRDDLTSPAVVALVHEHLAGMRDHSPPGHVHALALEGLRAPEVTFWTAWQGDALCGCGALKALGADAGEVKSMRTRPAFLRQGVAQAVLDVIEQEARARGYGRLLLETGTGDAFAAAHALYRRNGFDWCGPFGTYAATHFNVFMAKSLRAG